MLNSSPLVFEDHRLMSYDNGVESDRLVICFHGQGDYLSRYENWFHSFSKAGYRCVGIDFPGHGKSSGSTGDVGDFEFMARLLLFLKTTWLSKEQTFGIFGHSMGGLTALYWMQLVNQGALPKPYFLTISSPLLVPDYKVPSWKIALLKAAHIISPKLTISTQVNADSCAADSNGRLESKEHLALSHSRVSLRWGLAMIKIAEAVKSSPELFPDSLPIFVTQGTADDVTPATFCEDFFADKTSADSYQLVHLQNALHEPWIDPQHWGNIKKALDPWLTSIELKNS